MIKYIDKQSLEDNLVLEYIYNNKKENYYYSDDFSNEFYIKAAYEGFISVSYEEENNFVILPEMQFDYAVLYFENLHISKKVKKLLNDNSYSFRINKNIKQTLDLIEQYHEDSWIKDEYKQTLLNLQNYPNNLGFEIFSSEIIDKTTNQIIAAEIGYKIGAIYTSLSGFYRKEKKYNNYGKLQLVLLGKYLLNNGYKLWNLGHPYMKYKFDLGATLLSRIEFIKQLKKYRDLKI
ncbi:hypothetical protein CPU12_01905 [Malaciobacter molluscorum LMG 25693]|uniref:Leucyl/phenylalanyl-tRNA--protein transferase n=2 Tax=Malaciobacter molluscorum TaxID=1032072 RepID=A0A2G1DKH6_9BACT|nr:hypothetical protein CPU12_01905 [Malaciobacter molluscorum LMG 25693]